MKRIQENPANRVCADCMATDPSWGVCNLGIMVCIECSGVHRSMGILVSKVRSLELDRSIWTDSLIKVGWYDRKAAVNEEYFIVMERDS